MKRFQKYSCILFVALFLLSLIPFTAGAEINELSGTIWVLNTWQNEEGNVLISVKDETAALKWIGYYKEILFLNEYRYRMETNKNGQLSREEGNYELDGKKILILKPEGERENKQYEKIGDTIFLQEEDGMIGFVQSGYQSLYPENPGKESAETEPDMNPADSAETLSSMASDPFYGTHWVGTKLDSIFSGVDIEGDFFSVSIGDILSIATFVSSEERLKSTAYLSAVYVYMDFNKDYTFEFGMKNSVIGNVDESQSLILPGTWQYQDGTLSIYIDGELFPVIYENGKIVLNYSGFGITFSKVN